MDTTYLIIKKIKCEKIFYTFLNDFNYFNLYHGNEKFKKKAFLTLSLELIKLDTYEFYA